MHNAVSIPPFEVQLSAGFWPGVVRLALGGSAAVIDQPASFGQRQEKSDVQLVALIGRGDAAALQEMTVRYYRPICGFILKRAQRPELVEDLAQETFLEAIQALRKGTRPTHFSSWLFGIAFNRIGKWFRKRQPTLFPASEPPDTLTTLSPSVIQEEIEEQRHQIQQLETGLGNLPEETRRVLHMKHEEGKTCEQIAKELGQPVGTVKSQLSRAYKSLRERLTRSGDTD